MLNYKSRERVCKNKAQACVIQPYSFVEVFLFKMKNILNI